MKQKRAEEIDIRLVMEFWVSKYPCLEALLFSFMISQILSLYFISIFSISMTPLLPIQI